MDSTYQPNQSQEQLKADEELSKEPKYWIEYAEKLSDNPVDFKMYNTKWLKHLNKNSRWSIWTLGLFCYGLVPVLTALWNARSFDYNIENCYFMKSSTGQTAYSLPMSQCVDINHGTNMSVRGLMDWFDGHLTCRATYIIFAYQGYSILLVFLSLFYVYTLHKKAQVFALLLGLHTKPIKYKGWLEYIFFSFFVMMGLLLCVVRVYFEENQCITQNSSTYNIDGSQLSGYILFDIKQIGRSRELAERVPDFIAYFSMYAAILKILYNYFSNPWNTLSSIDEMIVKARKLQVDPAYTCYEINLKGFRIMLGYFLYYPRTNWKILLCASFERCYRHGLIKVIDEQQP